MGALKAIKIYQNDGRAVFLCLPKTKYRVTKGFKFHAHILVYSDVQPGGEIKINFSTLLNPGWRMVYQVLD